MGNVPALCRRLRRQPSNSTFEEPKPSFIPGFFRSPCICLTATANSTANYYMTADGQSIISGTLWNRQRRSVRRKIELLPKDGFSFGPADAPVNISPFQRFSVPLLQRTRQNYPRGTTQTIPRQSSRHLRRFSAQLLFTLGPAPPPKVPSCLGAQKPRRVLGLSRLDIRAPKRSHAR